jgi:hypothetical protein
MKHGDRSSEPAGGGEERDTTAVRPDFARGDREREEQMAEVDEPNFATKDIDPAEPDPIPPGTPSFATTDIDPGEVDPIDPDRPNYATRDQQLP